MARQTDKRARASRIWRKVIGSRRRVATVAAAGLAISLGYHVIFGQNGLTAFKQKRQSSLTLGRELAKLADENDLLQSRIEHLQTDSAAIERQAREELHYARPGEVIYSIPAAPAANRP